MHIPTRTLRRLIRGVQRRRTFQRCRRLPPGARIHVACGNVHLDGWINIDKFPTPATDFVVDVRYGLPFANVSRIFAEHFVEHLSFEEGMAFFKACRTALADDGILRLSTPNLDWVYETQYHPREWSGAGDAVRDCFRLNKSFRGWGHRFLFNFEGLAATLRDCGFRDIRPASYGVSEHADLQGLERHEKSPDLPHAPHVLVVEASGRASGGNEMGEFAADFRSAYHAR